MIWAVAWGSQVLLGMSLGKVSHGLESGVCSENIMGNDKGLKSCTVGWERGLQWGLLCWWDKDFLVKSHVLFEILTSCVICEVFKDLVIALFWRRSALWLLCTLQHPFFFPWILLDHQCIGGKSVHLSLSAPQSLCPLSQPLDRIHLSVHF